MPFEPGIGSKPYKSGRKGYEIEQAQLEKMRRILDRDLNIIERIQKQKEINPVDEKKLAISQARINKYLDKLHASRQTQEHSGQVNVIPIYGSQSTKSGGDIQGHDSDKKDIFPKKKD